MTVWLTRAGSHGEYEQKFINEKRIYLTWDDLSNDLSKVKERSELQSEATELYPDAKPRSLSMSVGQIWSFAHEMKNDDLVVLPLKSQPVIYVGKIVSGYKHNSEGPNPFYHFHDVEWIGEAIPRSNFAQDLLFSLGSLLTICRIQKNNAEERIRAMWKNGWKSETVRDAIKIPSKLIEETAEETDLVQLANDQIARLIERKFKGHNFTRLIEGILIAQGYVTYRSPEGPDQGADILAGTGPVGFGSPRLCIEVKSEANPIDRPTVDKLLGAVSKFGATEGLFVSWSGFKNNVQKELATSFFKIRLWSQNEILEQLFLHYDQLGEELKSELPMKRIWMITPQEDE